jgi:ABC-type amino acid transport substrate-binding protein
VTLARRKDVGFSVPIFPGGVGALLRSDSSFRLREVLNKGQQAGPFWRASPGQILEQQTFSAVKGTNGEAWLAGRLDKLQIAANVVPVVSYDAGVKRVLDRSSNVLFGDRAILLEAAKRNAPRELIVLERRFSFEPLALVLPRGDDDFRLAVDRALSRLFASPGFPEMYAKWFGPPDDYARTFFQTSVLPE